MASGTDWDALGDAGRRATEGSCRAPAAPDALDQPVDRVGSLSCWLGAGGQKNLQFSENDILVQYDILELKSTGWN